MRALLVGAGPLDMGASRLADEAASVDIVVAVDGGAAHCLAAGLTPHILLGDLDSVDAHVLETLDEGVERLVVSSDKDETDLELAVTWCLGHAVTSVVAAAVLGGRLDHELAAIGALSRAGFDHVRVINAAHAVSLWCTTSGWLEVPAGERFSVLSVSPSSTVTVTGARWELTDGVLEALSGRGVSNVAGPSGARVRVTEGRIAVIVPGSS